MTTITGAVFRAPVPPAVGGRSARLAGPAPHRSRWPGGLVCGLLTVALTAGCGGGNGSAEGGAENTDTTASGDGVSPILYYPDRLVETAPETFRVHFETTRGEFLVEVSRPWAPNGADRFYNLVKNGYYDGVYFHRVMAGFMAQFGMHGEPQVQVRWARATIEDDPVVASNTRGMLTYAKSRLPDSRTTQLFINYRDNSNLDLDGFAPFGQVIEGMEVVDQLHAGYGNIADLGGDGPDTRKIGYEGNRYLEENFPELDHIISARLVDSAGS